MAVNETHVHAPPDVVFDFVTDPASYSLWVVGSKRIRGVDADWPRPGSKLYHVVGWGPFADEDVTEVLEIEPPHRIRLEASAWPFGTAEVELTLTPQERGTHLKIVEAPRHGPAARFDVVPMEWAILARNALALRRLRRWAQQRHRGMPGHVP